MIRRWCIYLAGVLGCILFFLAYQGWIAWLILMGLLWLPALSLVLSLPAMLTMKLSIADPGTVTKGTDMAVRATVRSAMPLPPYRVRIRARRRMTGESRLLYVGDKLPTEHAGIWECVPEKCRVYDYLGLFGIPIRKSAAQTLTVWPAPVEMPVPRRLERYLSLGWRPKNGGFGENHDIRLFRPGDSMNQIHWKLSAKTGKLMVREPLEPVYRQIMVTVDMTGDAQALDKKLGKLLWLGQHLLDREFRFEVRAMTGEGLQARQITSQRELGWLLRLLMNLPAASVNTAQNSLLPGAWHCHIGGEPDEA